MELADEVVKTFKMLEDNGFSVVDVIFEGYISLEKKELIEKIQELAKERKAVGNIKLVYRVDDEEYRSIEIPVGELVPEENE